MKIVRWIGIGWVAWTIGWIEVNAQPVAAPSPEVSSERQITFRVFAPKADTARLTSSDLPGLGFAGVGMTKNERGVWEVKIGPVPAGAYRYAFNVDGTIVLDSNNPNVSPTNDSVFSLVEVPGSELFDRREGTPQGAVARVDYYSQTLKRFRRMHVYTPPDYDTSRERTYPVLYLLHGATDCDASWSTVGRAGVILDNLIASGRAEPMIVVMPHGHTGPFRFGASPEENAFERQMEEFSQEFTREIIPLIETRYRVIADRAHRALAGLSMGGYQTLLIGIDHLGEFGYLGIFSSGIFGIAGGFGADAPSDQWEKARKAVLDDANLKKGLKLVWFAIGKEDFLLKTSRATVTMLQRHGFEVISKETEGGHTWLNWRDNLAEFAPLLFKP
ncbi:esterase [Isosphaera pallida ATCC 43644]|uniref:Esterase n=1 Tax=Isosphaera pallida (strain ATCC 43644 / DSM 9630 / IS1B) TaxID=575540 RepID=E8QX62_ISOPI|nr:esterase [Isosphaera pallida ATCC 43644]